MLRNEGIALRAALAWHLDAGADWLLEKTPQTFLDRAPSPDVRLDAGREPAIILPHPAVSEPMRLQTGPLGTAEARSEAVECARSAQTLDALKAAIAGFDGIGLKNTATNLVFGGGAVDSGIMLIGDVPGAQDDRTGLPLSGVDGDWLDRAFAAAGIRRSTHIYSATLLNWRPPGNRSPNEAELSLSLPFIERHIQLVQPKILIFCGGVTAKTLLGSADSFSRLRGQWHEYKVQTAELGEGMSASIPAMVTHHPDSLAKTPAQKRGFWGDILKISQKKAELGFS